MQSDPSTSGDAQKTERGSGLPNVMKPTTRDVRLLAQALEERWPMDADTRAAAIRRLEAVVTNPDTRPRAFHVALRALAGLSRINLEVVKTVIQAEAHEDLAVRLTELERMVKSESGGAN